ncbi:helix-turn-helix domain-containing protein [Pseudonocardia asaccharolytica]|uniref:Transposase putative helix-turn-helix domain-containing protein n=1 Tax=Pseudonocardia asaccharolytica DSM 44247 = NBRC 16224 TaxID=1123024 RepID=A0A511CZB0_9PSEU|nr:helix-turn-helix domain-containing protein [Pseudonocardia asaccharolytica]GEL17881.1 hypothetical protein PA7_17180 [Pseudonocardia asaccharolytica DSM 44247 = NBRC 16224]
MPRAPTPAWPDGSGILGGRCHDVRVVIVRYRYRVYPTRGQARAFGCARVVYNDAIGEVIENPRYLRSRRRLARAQRALVRKQKGSANRRKAVRLSVRSWTRPPCGTAYDRDLNAARNILAGGRRVAAGPAETANACGGDVRPEPAPAVAREAGTHRGAA